jgi:hypothetical protein
VLQKEGRGIDAEIRPHKIDKIAKKGKFEELLIDHSPQVLRGN